MGADKFSREQLKQYAYNFIDFYNNDSFIEQDARYWWFQNVSQEPRGFATFLSLAQKNFKKKRKNNRRYERDGAYDRD